MTQPQQPDDDVGGMLKRVHQLGTVTEELFSRLYNGLNNRSELTAQAETIAKLTDKSTRMEQRNRLLRQSLEERDIEVGRLQGILTQISEGIIMQDGAGRIVMMNDAAGEMLGNQKNFWNTALGTLFNERRNIQSIGTELAPLGEAEQIEVNNRILSAQIAAIADKQSERIGTIIILRDVTHEALAARMKDSFVTHISHELITPLAPMRVASEILLNTPQDQPPNRRMLEMIGRNIDILDRMVSEMLDMSAMTGGTFQIEREPLQIENLIVDVVTGFGGDIQDNNLEVQIMLRDTDSIAFQGDHKHLRWAFSNLIRNAIYYNELKGHIIVQAGINRSDPQQMLVKVIDNGVGISEDDMSHIFKLFYRGEPHTREGKRLDPRGLGQGLFVARTVAEAHGGDLRAESEAGVGSTFVMSLPIEDTKALPA